MLKLGVVIAVCVGASLSAQTPPGRPAQIQELLQEARTLSAPNGQHRQALLVLDRAFDLAQAAGDIESQSRIDVQRGVAYRALSQSTDATAVLLRARARSTGTTFSSVAVEALNLLATLATDAGDVSQAGEWLREAMPIAKTAGNRTVYASLLESLGRNARAQGLSDEALRYATEAIEIAIGEGDYVVAARALGARSTTLLGLGRLDEALADAERAFALANEHEPRMRSSTLFSLAQAHAHVWNLDRAADLWTQAIASYESDNLRIGVALATRQRMDTWSAMGEYEKAAQDGETALALMEETGSAGARPGVLARLALIATQRDRPDDAARYAAEARRTADDSPSRRFIDNDLGLVALSLGHVDGAASSFVSVLARAEALADPEYQWRAHYGLGRVAQAEKRYGMAADHFQAAVALIERMRRELPEAELRAAFLSDRTIAYAGLATVLLNDTALGDDAARAGQALEVAERARSRSLADLLAESQRRLTDPALAAIRDEERKYSSRLTTLQKAILEEPDPGVRATLDTQLREAERDYDSMVVRVRRDNPVYAGLVYPEPLDAATLISIPADDEVLVEFLFDADAVGHAWVVGAGEVTSYEIPSAPALEASVRLFGAMISAHDAEGVKELGAHLFEQLLGPARGRIDPARRIIIVPSGPLHRLPFASLRPAPDRWLFEDHALSLAPSMTVLAELRRRFAPSGARPLLAFAASSDAGGVRRGTPTLAYADAEIRDVARLLSAYDVRWSGPKRAEVQLKQATGDYRVLHFSTHAVIDEVVPRRSAILLDDSLDEDGLLQLNEIPNLAVRAELVVLAACQSQVGRRLNGEGLLSLSRAFMRAGSQAVLATLWEVDDAQTREFMVQFYTALGTGVSADVALVSAQRHMIRLGGAAAQPEVWAAFVLNGDTTRPVLTASRWPPLWGTALVFAASLMVWWLLWRRYSTRNLRAGVTRSPAEDRYSTNQR